MWELLRFSGQAESGDVAATNAITAASGAPRNMSDRLRSRIKASTLRIAERMERFKQVQKCYDLSTGNICWICSKAYLRVLFLMQTLPPLCVNSAMDM